MVKQRLSMLGMESHDYATIVNSVIGGRLPFNESFQSIHCFDHGLLYFRPLRQVLCVGLESSRGLYHPGFNVFLFETC